MVTFNMEDYTKDVQAYIKSEWSAANRPMYLGEKYINWQNIDFIVLEDSPVGNTYVKCKCKDKFGTYVGYRPKIVLLS